MKGQESLRRMEDVTPLGADELQDEWCKSCHLRYYPPKIRPRAASWDITHPR